jgi:hypothetical protein
MWLRFAVLTVLAACAHAKPSRWDRYGNYTVCRCEGVERQPSPSEADDFRPGERVDLMCEGKVTDCYKSELWPPYPPKKNYPFDPHVQD